MIRGGDFYAVWIEEHNLWSTDEQDALQLIDRELDRYAEENRRNFDSGVKILHMWDAESGMIDSWHKYCQKQMRDSFHMLDEKLIFSNVTPNKKDYASKKLNYPLEAGDLSAYDKLMSTLYTEEERHKIEWAIGSVVSGESKKLQKFMVLYGAAGTGKSTVLNIIQQLFEGYYSIFDAKALGSSNNSLALESFRSNPLVAIQHDGDLSRIEDNTRINSLVSHELMTVNEKFKSAYSNRFKCFLFIAADVAEALEYAEGKAHQMLELVDGDEKLLDIVYRAGQNREVWFLTENGLYEVLMQSRKPIAKQFKAAVKIALRNLRINKYSYTKVNLNHNNVVTIRNTRIFFKNFEGREEKFNEFGNRNFHVEVDADTARKLKADGWNVKTRIIDDEDETYFIKVKINFDGHREPKIILISGSNQVALDRDSVKAIDTADIAKVDLTINGWEWDPGKMSGYLATMYVTLNVDDITAEYSNMRGDLSL